ncbi:MAG: phosphoribosyltransferase family protein [Verrucomicrobia bacterium]|nr:phosphoribosyltransferase family protein [Verrucomicrobiota bacterium]
MKIYKDRAEAGRLLAQALTEHGVAQSGPERGDLLVLAIPRGGVVVGAEVARALQAPLDVWLARKIGAPGNPELAIGSVASHGELVIDRRAIAALGVGADYLQEAVRHEREELRRRMWAFRGHAEPVRVEGRTVVLVDDGVATGATAFSALAALERGGAAQRIFAAPVAPVEVVPELEEAADLVVLLSAEPVFHAVGQFYEHFEQVSDQEVIALLAEFSR